MVTVVQGKVCAKNHPDRLSRLATIHQRYRQTDGRISYGIGLDLTVGQKGQYNKKSQKCYISPIWGKAPTGPIRLKSCTVGDVRNVITCAKFQIEIFMGYDFTVCQIFDFPIDFCMGLTTLQRSCT